MSHQYTASLVGATGLVGSRCLDLLIKDPACTRIIAPVRKKSARVAPSEKLQIVPVDFERLSQYGDVFRAERIFCCLGTTKRKAGSNAALASVDRDLVVKIARLASMVGAKHFSVVSSSGADLQSPFFYLRTKAEMENEILRMPFSSVHILRPALLLGEREEFRFSESLASFFLKKISPILPARIKPIGAETLAEAMIDLPKHSEFGKKIFESEALQRGAKISSILQ